MLCKVKKNIKKEICDEYFHNNRLMSLFLVHKYWLRVIFISFFQHFNQWNGENAVESFSLKTKGGSFQDEMFYLNFNTAKCQRDLIVEKLKFKKTVLESCEESLCWFNHS